jgi:hypothetical protein
MSIGPILFWILMAFWLIFGIVVPRWYRPAPGTHAVFPLWVGDVFLFVLLLILGAHVFGVPRL